MPRRAEREPCSALEGWGDVRKMKHRNPLVCLRLAKNCAEDKAFNRTARSKALVLQVPHDSAVWRKPVVSIQGSAELSRAKCLNKSALFRRELRLRAVGRGGWMFPSTSPAAHTLSPMSSDKLLKCRLTPPMMSLPTPPCPDEVPSASLGCTGAGQRCLWVSALGFTPRPF